MATFFYLGGGSILGCEFTTHGNVESAWYIHRAYELEMCGRSCVTESEDNYSDLAKAVKYGQHTAESEWCGTPRSVLEVRARVAREDEAEVWYVRRDPEFSPMVQACPRWAAEMSGQPFFMTQEAAIAAMQESVL
jgi:hypothetical protein